MRTTLLLLPTLFAPLALAPSTAAAPILVQDDVPTMQEANELRNSGQTKAAAEAYAKIAKANPQNGAAVFFHAYCLHMLGDLKAAHDRHLDAAEFEQFRPIALYNHACVHALWNEPDIAFRSLREAMDAGFSNPEQLRTDTDMDNLREDARFKAILAEMSGEAPPEPESTAVDLASLDPARRFDWYVGSWNMMLDGELEQTLTVERALGGNGLRVSMKDTEGNETANSIYSYDATKKTWRQTWVSSTGDVITMAGGMIDGAMALAVETDTTGSASNGRSVFRNIETGTCTYVWQTTEDGGKTWSDVAARTFVRQ